MKQSLFSTKNGWFKLLVFLSIIMAYFLLNKSFKIGPKEEGFQQMEKYVVKRGCDVYDDFYVDIYDHLNQTESRNKFEMEKILTATQADKHASIILDVGCGTGCLVENMRQAGYKNVYGVDKSQAMVEYAREKSKTVSCKLGDVMSPMEFAPSTFSHILCVEKTIYEFADKTTFFRNAYSWLTLGGYLAIHVVVPTKFDPIVPIGKPREISNIQKYSKEGRITTTMVDFGTFTYKNEYDFNRGNHVERKETFTDLATKNVRTNEMTLHMDSIETILEIAKQCRFNVVAQFTYEKYNSDANQFIYILKKI
jgi:ubiquinone/menaquinone biosynthesis C-methylase UbiE